MVGKTKTPTAAEKARMTLIKDHMPCICCLLKVNRKRLPTVHHVVDGNRLGHRYTFSLCTWHHQAETVGDMTTQECIGFFGPSLDLSSREFKAHFGSQQCLLELQDLMIKLFEIDPWIDYAVPNDVRREVLILWAERRN